MTNFHLWNTDLGLGMKIFASRFSCSEKSKEASKISLKLFKMTQSKGIALCTHAVAQGGHPDCKTQVKALINITLQLMDSVVYIFIYCYFIYQVRIVVTLRLGFNSHLANFSMRSIVSPKLKFWANEREAQYPVVKAKHLHVFSHQRKWCSVDWRW